MHGLTISGLAAGLALAPSLDFSASDIGLTALTAGLGGWAIGWLPALRRDGDEAVAGSEAGGGVIAGVGLGTAAVGGPIESRIGTQLGVVAGSVTGLATGVVLTGLLGLGAPEREVATLPIDPSGALAAEESSTSSSAKRTRSRRRITDPLGRRTPLVANWTPAVIMEPDVDASTGEPRKGSMKMLFGLRGLLH